MQTELMVKNKDNSNRTGLVERVKRRFKGPFKKLKTRNKFGRDLGVIWEFRRSDGEDPVVCLVKIEQKPGSAKVTICDGNDPYGPSPMNAFEDIATGVYLEHLSDLYLPTAVKFILNYTQEPLSKEPEWGEMPVGLLWNSAERRFEDPKWGQWIPEFIIPQPEKDFIEDLRMAAGVEVERVMRERNARGEVTPRERELYDRFQDHISAKSERYRYSLKGGRIFGRSED